MLFPQKTKFKKQFKKKLKGKTTKGNKIVFGKFALKVLYESRLSSRQIEATKRTIVRKMKRLGFIWVRIFPDVPVTSKPTENRMGKGKGSVTSWVAKVKQGQILYEISGLSSKQAKVALKAGANKLPIKTKFIYK